MRLALAILLLTAVPAYAAFTNGLGFRSTVLGKVTVVPVTGALLLEDGTSYLLLEDGTSKLLLE